ncbi:hypothetical protein HUU42_17035, partial [bacterium]|nr:hypothetical protein [bacterium]
MFGNGRIDNDQLLASPFIKKTLGASTLHSLIDLYFNHSKAPFTRGDGRFLLTLGDIQKNLTEMVNLHEESFGGGRRSTVIRNYDDASYTAGAKDDGINMTGYAYFRQNPASVFAQVADKAHLPFWVPWLANEE